MNKIDKYYWANDFPYPFGPSEKNVDVYKDYLLEGETLLLGCTKRLMPLSKFYMDIDPWYEGPEVIKGNWINNNVVYTNIIGDGVLNLNKELCDNVLDMASKYSKRFVVRSFSRKLEGMKIASYFPSPKDFLISPDITLSFDKYKFFVWNFHE